MLIDTDDLMKRMAWREGLMALWETIASDSPKRWQAIRDYYAEIDQYIRARWPGSFTPYLATDWRFMTPIEVDAWNAIRRLGLPFYPQYPVGRYFVDFADPVRQVAVECDGRAWHDARKDAARDLEIGKLGWKVHRFTGRQCVLPEADEQSIDSFFMNEATDFYSAYYRSYSEE